MKRDYGARFTADSPDKARSYTGSTYVFGLRATPGDQAPKGNAFCLPPQGAEQPGGLAFADRHQ
ncbi:hypothetical protein GCM10010320_08040 [Streptomyces caelestis]|nr:hypothetical protein GCM10010320_08040 [Streptomyces caelestis]